jgi:sodium-dependent dicarboxylate transporter 2/3/5
MALGRMLIETGAVKQLTILIAASGPSGGLGTVALFAAFGCFLTELSSNTAAASIALPVVISITQAIGLNPVPYMLLTVVAVNCAYVLPVSTRAIPVSYGLDAGLQIRKGLRLTILNVLLVTALGWFCINYVPFFSRF